MHNIKVDLTQNEYRILIYCGLLDRVGEYLVEKGFKRKAVIITNPVINQLYGDQVRQSLVGAGLEPAVLEVPDGEDYKSLDWAGSLYTQMADLKVERLTPVLALGGGVIGDLAGFVAATYMRGIPLFQIPTTLLAQVDSSIGGKVAVNHGQLKNNVGTFYQPRLVISDVKALKTLPFTQVSNGLAEIIKYGAIRDRDLFQLIENNLADLKSLELEITEKVIARCAAIKAEIVEKDERDLGLRNVLNFGHTAGHAIETVSDFKISHGQAVAIGMVAAGMISCRLGFLKSGDLDRIRSVVIKAGLPVSISGLEVDQLVQAMTHDKKNAGGKIKFILLKAIGEVFVSDSVKIDLVEQVLKEMYE